MANNATSRRLLRALPGGDEATSSRVEVAIPAEEVDDLARRLRTARFVDEIEGISGWEYGTSVEQMRDLVWYWSNSFDWRVHEARLNRQPQYRTTIDDCDLHFVHLTTGSADAIPILLAHSWPGSVLEMLPLAQRLVAPTSPQSQHFDVVIPSLPGFGFSGRPDIAGFGLHDSAMLLASLMDQLGYAKYLVHGGDVGAAVCGYLALECPAVLGLHTLDPYVPVPDVSPPAPPLTSEETRFIARRAEWSAREGAYAHVQSTKPQTLGYSLNDSPIGLAAWLIEKYHSWSARATDWDVAAYDQILTVVSIYWFTQTISSSIRLYYENAKHDPKVGTARRIPVPTAVAMTPVDETHPPRDAPRAWVERVHNVRQWTELPGGGHFASYETPDAVAASISALASIVRS